MGAILELTSDTEWFGDITTDLTLHVIDSMRPYNLSSLFLGGDIGERFIIWDDGEADKLQEEQKAWETLQVCNIPNKFDFAHRVCSTNLNWVQTMNCLNRSRRKMTSRQAISTMMMMMATTKGMSKAGSRISVGW
jgi:hypothetical protein